MTDDDLVAMWNEDALVPLDYEQGIKEIPKLHVKYLNIYLKEQEKLAIYTGRLKKLKREKKDFFMHPTSKKHEKGWELPPQGAILKSEINSFLEGDEDIIKEEIRISKQNVLIDGIQRILRQIETRTFLYKDLIEERKFKAGL